MKQLRVGPFTVTEQITNTTYEIQEDTNAENIKVTHRNYLIEFFPKEPFIISPLQESTNIHEMSKRHAALSPNADSRIQSPSTPSNDDHIYQKLTSSLLPPLQTPILPITPMPIRVPTILRTTPQYHEAEQSTSSSPKKKNKVADLTSKVKAKYKRSHPDSSLRDLERRG